MAFGFSPDDLHPDGMMEAAARSGTELPLAPMGAADLLGADEGEYLEPGDGDVSEPHPRPIDWRVRRFWDNAEERRKLARTLCEEIQRARDAFQWRLDNCKIWRDDFEMMPAAVDTPYTGAATCRAPFTRYACAAHSRQLNAQIVDPEPVVTVEAMDPAALEDALDIEEAMNGRIEDSDWEREARALHEDLPQVGNGYLRVEYERRVKRAPKLKIDQEEADYLDAYRGLLLAGADPLSAQYHALKRDKKGRIPFAMSWDESVEHEGATYKFIPFEDGIVFPATCRDAGAARGIGEQFVISGLDLEQGAKSGLFIQSEVDALLKRPSDDSPGDRQDRLDHSGIEVASAQGALGDADAKYRDYLCWRLSLRLDGDDDGKEEILLVTLHPETESILDIRFSPYEHGEHIYHLAPFAARPGELLGYGIAETVATLQDAATAVWNQLINHGDLQIHASSCVIVDDSAMLDPEVKTFQMGSFFRVRDSRGIREWPVTSMPTEHYQLFQQMKDQVDLIAGVSNPSLGKGTDVGRTAREVMVVESHASANFEGVARGLSLFWARVWDQVRSIEAQYAREGQVRYRRNRLARAAAEGPEGAFGSIDADRLLARVRVLPAGLRQISDMGSRMQQAMAMMAAFRENVLTAQNPQVQRIAIEQLMEAAKYGPKEKVLVAIDQAIAQAQMAAAQQQAQMSAMGLDPAALEMLQSLPPEMLKGLMAQAQEQMGALPPSAPPVNETEAAQTGLPPMPGEVAPEAGGIPPGVMG